MPEHDSFHLLQEAWQNVDTPPAVRTLDEEDVVTQEAVAWMSDAWAQIEIPDAPLMTLRKSKHRRRRTPLHWRALTLPAAAALLMAALIFWNAQQTAQPTPSTPGVTAAVPLPVAPQLLATRPELVQMRSGKVRLTMLRGTQSLHDQNSTDS